ncbi:MAG: T9SS type A sorting domain-containing protein, partial [Bacteroidota bacterium]
PGFVESSTNLLGMITTQAYNLNDAVVEPVDFQLSEPDENYTLSLPEDGNGFASTLTGLSLGRMYYVEPQKNTDPQNGLSSFEIFLAQRLLLGYEVPEVTHPLQIVGLDMNCSQSFSAIDLLIMQSLLVGDVAEVPGCNSWTFIPDHHVFPTDFDQFNVFPAPRRAEIMLQGDSTVMFTGVKNGDLLGDADPGRSSGVLPLTVNWPAGTTTGSVVDLSLTVAELRDLVAFQGELRLADGLEFVGVTDGDLPELKVGESLAARGRLFLSWFSTTGEAFGAAAGAEVVTIAVRVTEAYVPGTRPLAFNHSSSYLAAAHGGDGTSYRPEINLSSTETNVFCLHPASPNPAAAYTDLNFDLPLPAEVSLTVLDGLGRSVIRRTQRLDAGANRFRLDTRALPAGTYVYQLVAGEDVGVDKLVVRR